SEPQRVGARFGLGPGSGGALGGVVRQRVSHPWGDGAFGTLFSGNWPMQTRSFGTTGEVSSCEGPGPSTFNAAAPGNKEKRGLPKKRQKPNPVCGIAGALVPILRTASAACSVSS